MVPPERSHLRRKGESTMQKPYGCSERLAEDRLLVGRPFKEGGTMRWMTGMALVLTVVVGLLGGCSTAPASREDKAALVAEAAARLKQMSAEDPALGALVKRSHGLSMFPNVGKGGLGVGGAYGRGVVYERGQHVGYSDVTQGSVGLQVGGQSFSELLLFENKAALDRFKAGQLSFGADASAVVMKSGVATNANFVNGVAVVISPIGGAMLEAAIGGQQFTYQPK
jgi:lipid-binding SYLF domain-containing protein